MPSIQILPEHLRNVIAAGEVIERPASVVKELIENSIDAGAENIRIEVLYGGKKLIKVTDDGCGMDRKDALLSIERYATSKISSIEDLFRLRTLGFRGEALASIASVSKLTIETGRDRTEPATFLEVIGGVIKQIREVAPLKGTIVTARDLFFNTPARRKFLKANSTELNHILEVIISEGLSGYSREYRLFADDTEILSLWSVQTPLERIQQVFGAEAVKHFVEIHFSDEFLRLHAFISKPPELRSRKTGQYIFINNRPVKDYLISKAIYDGLSRVLPRDKHPLCVLYLDINPSEVDFNVHPTKREVRFQDGARIYEFIKQAIEENIHRFGLFTEGGGIGFEAPVSPDTFKPKESSLNSSEIMEYKNQNESTLESVEGISGALSIFERTTSVYGPSGEGESINAGSFFTFGDVFVAMPAQDGVIIMDKHAAHERVLYEKFLGGSIITKKLLFPKQVHLQPVHYRIILGLKDILKDMGIKLEDFGPGTVIVRTVPEVFDIENLGPIIEDIAEAFRSMEDESAGEGKKGVLQKSQIFWDSSIGDRIKTVAATLACHRSVRGRDQIGGPEIEALCRDLFNTSDPYHCPHGRPTMLKISLEEILKRFGRR